MRMADRRGVEYEVTYDAERGRFVYRKVFKPGPDHSNCNDGNDEGAKAVSAATEDAPVFS